MTAAAWPDGLHGPAVDRARVRRLVLPRVRRLARSVLWRTSDLVTARREARLAVRQAVAPPGYDAELDAALDAAIRRSLAERPGDPGALNDAMEAALDPFRDRSPWTPEWRTFADQLLDGAVAALERVLDEQAEVLRGVAAAERRVGAGRREVMDAVVAAARQMDPQPPAWLVEQVAAPPLPAPRLQPYRRRPSFYQGITAHG